MLTLIKKLFGGYPMKKGKHLLQDLVSFKQVFLYTDTLGRKWMATGAWNLSRVEYYETPQSGDRDV